MLLLEFPQRRKKVLNDVKYRVYTWKFVFLIWTESENDSNPFTKLQSGQVARGPQVDY